MTFAFTSMKIKKEEDGNWRKVPSLTSFETKRAVAMKIESNSVNFIIKNSFNKLEFIVSLS